MIRPVTVSQLILCSLLLVFSLAGCGRDESGPLHLKPSRVLAENEARAQTDRRALMGNEIKASHPWRITFLMKNYAWANPYWRRTQEGLEVARRDFGVYMRALGVEQYDTQAQIKTLDDLIVEHKTDGIIIAPVDSNRLAPVTEKAVAAGLPVIVYDTPLNADGTLTFVGFDNFKAGRLLGRWVVEQLGGHGDVLIMEGLPGQQNSLDRRNGMIAGLREGDINVLGLRSGHWQRDTARKIAADWLKRFDHIGAIMAADDVMALGVVDALKAAGRHDIIVTGFDANADALLAIRQGDMQATIEQAPKLLARRAVQLMVRHLETGETFPPTQLWNDIRLVTAENVVQFQR